MDNEYKIYRERVWEFLDTMEVCVNYEISSLCVPENKNKFIACVKSYMDAKPWQGWLSFNRDYSIIYKIHEIIFKKEFPNE